MAVLHKYRVQTRGLEIAAARCADYRCAVCGLEWRRDRAGWRTLGRDAPSVRATR